MELQFAFKKKPPRCGGGCTEVTLPSVAPAARDDDGDGAFCDGVSQMPELPMCKARYQPTRMRGTSSSLPSPLLCDVALGRAR